MENVAQKLNKCSDMRYSDLQGLTEDKQEYAEKEAQILHKNSALLPFMRTDRLDMSRKCCWA